MLIIVVMMKNSANPTPPSSPLRIGIEIGGAKLQAALGDPGCRLLRLEHRTVQPQQARPVFFGALPPMLDALLKGAGANWREVASLGIGFGGPVDAAAVSC